MLFEKVEILQTTFKKTGNWVFMKLAQVTNHMPWLLGIAGIFVFFNIDSMWSTWSVDLAHHYALAFRISEQWILTSQTDPTLGEMNFYPRGSHIIAATLGILLNSTFLGIQLTTLVSFALLWLCAILILNSLPRERRTITLITFIGLIAINSWILKFDLHGHEIIGNFFYSQLVGHAILFLSIIIAIRVEKKRGTLWACAALVPMMLINATIHLLPAIEMLGLIAGLIVVYVLVAHQKNQAEFRRLAFATAILIFSMGGLILHPSFSAMRKISENNGDLELSNISYPTGLTALCIAVIITSAFLSFQWIKSKEGNDILAVKYLALYGGATAGLCLLQYVLSFLGQGTDYAVKKYGFGLITILILQLSIILPGFLLSFARINYIIGNRGISNLHVYILILALIAALFLNTPYKKSIDVSEVVLTERKLIHLADTILPLAEEGKSNVVIGLNGFSTVINYLFSISITRTPRNLALSDVLIKNELPVALKYSYVVSSATNNNFGSASCESISKGTISIITSKCLEERTVAAKHCQKSFDLSINGLTPSGLLKGFSDPEGHGRWSDGISASFECLAGYPAFKSVKIEVTPFIYGSLKSQRIEVSLNGKVVRQENLSTARGVENPIVIDLPQAPDLDKYNFEFKFPDATSPKDVGLNKDGRKLGFSFQRIIFE